MSKVIDFDKPISDDDRAYLHNRSLDWQIEVNDRRFAKVTADREPAGVDKAISLFNDEVKGDWEDKPKHDLSAFDPDLVKEIQALNDASLADELNSRNVDVAGSSDRAHMEFLLVQAVSKGDK